jgi:hypothetical protein
MDRDDRNHPLPPAEHSLDTPCGRTSVQPFVIRRLSRKPCHGRASRSARVAAYPDGAPARQCQIDSRRPSTRANLNLMGAGRVFDAPIQNGNQERLSMTNLKRRRRRRRGNTVVARSKAENPVLAEVVGVGVIDPGQSPAARTFPKASGRFPGWHRFRPWSPPCSTVRL